METSNKTRRMTGSKVYKYFILQVAVLMTRGVRRASAANETGSSCNVYTFVPFTDNGRPAQPFFTRGRDGEGGVNPGFMHMASAILAMEHFNQRNATVVPEIDSLGDCRFQFDINNSRFFDSGSDSHMASRAVAQHQLRTSSPPPCAAAGPFYDMPSMDLGYMASAFQFPLVMHRSFNARSVLEEMCPYSSSVYPDSGVLTERLAYLLLHFGRTDFVSVYYPLTDLGLQWKDVLSTIFQVLGIQTFQMPIYNDMQESRSGVEASSVLENLQAVKDRGFRTIVVPMDVAERNLPLIADAAEELEMNNGDYLWVWVAEFSPSHLFSENHNITKLLYGSVWVAAIEDANLPGKASPFQMAVTSQSGEFADRVNFFNPILPGQLGYAYADPDFFTSMSGNPVEYGAGFMYDAVMSIGFGACAAEESSVPGAGSTNSGAFLLQGIRSSGFSGASGKIRFSESFYAQGVRDPKTAMFGAFNLIPNSIGSKPYRLSAIFRPELGIWVNLSNMTFADGRSVPPDLLRDPPPQNYLPAGLTALGFCLFGSVVVLALMVSLWVFVRRSNKVLRAAQPYFLYLLSFGSVVFSSAIVPLSFDEGDGWSDVQLSHGCQAVPWLISIGHIVTYGSLFGKLWRVNKVLQFRRQKISVRQVMWPFAVLALAALLVLALWTGLDPLMWTRVEIDPWTGESTAYCQSPNTLAFAIPLGILMLIPTLLTGIMAWKTKDVDAAFSDSSWIFTLILIQVELLVIGVPLVVILRSVSLSGRYVGFIVLLWVFPMTTLALIMLPKVVAYRRSVLGLESSRMRGSRETVRVTGLATTPAATGVASYLQSMETGSSLTNSGGHESEAPAPSKTVDRVDLPERAPR
jgi:7 transmembrane sweet-taste receptor of 3 GCPR/Receptor family ligand binding region